MPGFFAREILGHWAELLRRGAGKARIKISNNQPFQTSNKSAFTRKCTHILAI